MKALKDAGIVPEKKVRLILGLDEETGWKGMDYYLKHSRQPNFGFTPDGEFPAIHGEMGILIFDLVKKIGKSSTDL
jgi:succinyl-diaminopimelate desuccinylase